MSVMVLQGRKSSPQKSRPPESGHRRHGVWIAIEYSYKLGQKKNLNSGAYLAGFRRSSHICQIIDGLGPIDEIISYSQKSLDCGNISCSYNSKRRFIYCILLTRCS